ncbi:MAG: hypothetical protein D6762_04080 [Candidatus Neomarinimicrobiota bacterium]|nr:MAG: hypothetical protein D6762_04080 [Candidatus Neomarinimicrobiota bacterium]
MKDAIKTISEWLKGLTDLLLSLIGLGIVAGILFDDMFGVIDGIGRLMSKFGENGLAGLLALILIVMWYQKK